MNEYLTISGVDHLAIASTDEARQRRDELLKLSARIEAVTTPEEALAATETMRELKRFTTQVEDAKKTIKGPVLDVGRRIDDTAKSLAAMVVGEYERIGRVLGVWQTEQRKREDEARRKAWEEEQRIKREAAEKLREAEAKSRTAASFEKKADKIEAKAMEQIAETRTAAALVKAQRPAGVSVRRVPQFEVTDIEALYEAAPTLVVMTPNKAAINAMLRTLPEGKTIPGIRHWFEEKASIR